VDSGAGRVLAPQEQKRLTVAEFGQEFLDRVKAKKMPKTDESYCYFLVPFVERFGAARAATFPSLTFDKGLDEHAGWIGCEGNAVISVLAMVNWGVKKRLLSKNPLSGTGIPPKRRRNRILTPDEREYLFGIIRDEQFRQYMFALLDTGCRPSEVINVTAAHVSRDGTRWTFKEHKTSPKTQQDRIVYLLTPMQELTRKLVALYPEGPLFRSTRCTGGVRRAWTLNGIRCRFKRLHEKVAKLRAAEMDPEKRAKLPDLSGVTAYVCRHTYATDALTMGLPIPVVSALLGHQDTRMVNDTYNHTDQASEILWEVARKASHKANGANE
jgi:integrase